MNEKFVNVWCLNSELKQLQAIHGKEGIPPLMKAIIEGWKPDSPVDSLVISPELKLLGRQPANELLFFGPDATVVYDGFLNGSLAGEKPGLGGENAKGSNRSVDDLDRLTIELIEPGKFKIDGNGPLNAKEARAEAIRIARGKPSVLVFILSNSESVSDDEYKDFKESLHSDGGMLEGIEIKGVGEFGR